MLEVKVRSDSAPWPPMFRPEPMPNWEEPLGDLVKLNLPKGKGTSKDKTEEKGPNRRERAKETNEPEEKQRRRNTEREEGTKGIWDKIEGQIWGLKSDFWTKGKE